jgi:hypothetical protein
VYHDHKGECEFVKWSFGWCGWSAGDVFPLSSFFTKKVIEHESVVGSPGTVILEHVLDPCSHICGVFGYRFLESISPAAYLIKLKNSTKKTTKNNKTKTKKKTKKIN